MAKPFIRVFVPTTVHGPDGVAVGVNGTAYPIGDGLIITARHVIHPTDKQGANIRDSTRPILVCWCTDPEPDPRRRWRRLNEERPIAWDGGDDIDAIVLACDYPVPVPNPGIVSGRPPRQDEVWHASGYPLAGLEEDPYDPSPFRGFAHEIQGQSKYFHIQFDAGGNPLNVKEWGGASGMPILRGDLILGLATEARGAFETGRLLAVPACRIHRSPGFAELLGDTGAEDRRAFFRASLKSQIEVSPRAREEIAGRLARVGLLRSSADNDSEAVAAGLFDHGLPIEQVLELLYDAFDAIGRQRSIAESAGLAEAAVCLRRAAGWLFAGRHYGVAGAINTHRKGAAGPLCPLPTTLAMVAEIYVAAALEREPEFQARREETLYPPGTRNLQRHAPAEGGIRARQTEGDELRTALLKKLVPADWPNLRTRLRKFLLDDVLGTDNQEPSTAEGDAGYRENMERLNNAIRRAGVYMASVPPRDDADRRLVQNALETLKGDLKDLMMFHLDGDPGTRTREMDAFQPFRDLLPRT